MTQNYFLHTLAWLPATRPQFLEGSPEDHTAFSDGTAFKQAARLMVKRGSRAVACGKVWAELGGAFLQHFLANSAKKLHP
jgi:hypothetical protein